MRLWSAGSTRRLPDLAYGYVLSWESSRSWSPSVSGSESGVLCATEIVLAVKETADGQTSGDAHRRRTLRAGDTDTRCTFTPTLGSAPSSTDLALRAAYTLRVVVASQTG
jgi:hypothetical protein